MDEYTGAKYNVFGDGTEALDEKEVLPEMQRGG